MVNSTTCRRLNKDNFYQLISDPALLVGVVLILASLILFIVYPLYSAAKLSLSKDGIFSLNEYKYIFTHSYYKRSIINSVMLGVIVASLSTFVGFIFAYAIAKGKVKGRGFFQSMAILPIISPPFMFALSVILLFGRNGLITAKLLHLDTAGIYGLKGLVIVQVITMYPIAYMTLVGILQGIDPDLESCAMNLGAKRLKTFFTVTLPLALPGIFASWLLVFVGSLTDFGNPIIIGG
ncbi:MAG: iron ABC transporter permease, partial [Spirochaetales bacterium]|nr:iron ABC transporter permease [Spirochaetales bacterium]